VRVKRVRACEIYVCVGEKFVCVYGESVHKCEQSACVKKVPLLITNEKIELIN